MAAFARALMVKPSHFAVKYAINPWMGGTVDRVMAMSQWEGLKAALEQAGVKVSVLDQAADVPDMVFCCNAGLVYGNKVYLSHFRYPERQPERAYYKSWFLDNGYETHGDMDIFFEGGGDAFFAGPSILLAGYGARSQREVYAAIEKTLGTSMQDGMQKKLFETVECELVSSKFYHNDVCIFPLDEKSAVWYPQAFSATTQARIKERFGHLIAVSDKEAAAFACNGLSVPQSRTVILPTGCPETKVALEETGRKVLECEMGEFMKAGGACQCLVLKLFDP